MKLAKFVVRYLTRVSTVTIKALCNLSNKGHPEMKCLTTDYTRVLFRDGWAR